MYYLGDGLVSLMRTGHDQRPKKKGLRCMAWVPASDCLVCSKKRLESKKEKMKDNALLYQVIGPA